MSDGIKLFHSMTDFYTALGGTMEQDFDCTIHCLEEVHSDPPITSPLFRANYYSIVLIRTGRGRYIIDRHSYPTQPCTIYFTNPGHIKGFEIHERSTGYILTFGESFLKQYVHSDAFAAFPFLLAEVAPPQYPNQAIFDVFDHLGDHLLHEFQSQSVYKAQMLGGFLRVLLFKIKELFWNTYDPLMESDSGSQIVATFKHHLEAHFRSLVIGHTRVMSQVQHYAAAQQLHPNYLSAVIRSKTGKSVQQWIAEKTIAEAQALLSRSTASVQDVAYCLAFKEPGHFSRFFKKHTGLTPSEFRDQWHVPPEGTNTRR